MSNVIDFASEARARANKEERTHEVEGHRMPGVNPAQVSMSVFLAKTYDQIMVKRLGKALQAKLKEFSK